VLEGALERITVGELYCDLPLGLYIIRGENVVLIGELVSFLLKLDVTYCPLHMSKVERRWKSAWWFKIDRISQKKSIS
jgi:hypothetical protein